MMQRNREVFVKLQKQSREVFYKKAVLKNFDTCLFASLKETLNSGQEPV